MTATAIGPVWSSRPPRDFAGRYPLSVERHVIASVAHLLPGVTTVTPHARYYTLHALIANEIKTRELDAVAAQELLRRAEVTLAGASLVHGQQHHPHSMQPHGADKIRPDVTTGSVRVAELAASKVYAQAKYGFWGPYLASETLLGLVEPGPNVMIPGEAAGERPLREGLHGILEAARRDVISVGELAEQPHLCLCGAATRDDGELLLSRLLPQTPQPGTRGNRRAQTIRLLLRLIALHPDDSELWAVLAFEPGLITDPVLAQLDVTRPWTGVVLRNRMVKAWRDLWSWLINTSDRLSRVDDLQDRLADAMPEGTVGGFMDTLPVAFGPHGVLQPAEVEIQSQPRPLEFMSSLAIASVRSASGLLHPETAAYFEHPKEAGSQLTPSWMNQRLTEWNDRPVRDFAWWLVEVLLERSQWIAMRKARFHRQTGVFQVPTRVSLRDDGFLIKYSDEGGGGVGLRWTQLASVLSELGLLERQETGWRITELGESI